MLPSEILARHRGEIREIMKRYPRLRDIKVFGSVARGEDTEDSDIDFMVEQDPEATWHDLGGLRFDLEDLLGVPVDVISADDRFGKAVKEQMRNEAIHGWSDNDRQAMKDQRTRKYLGDIDASARRILTRLDGVSCESFVDPNNEDLRDIAARQFSILGEAAAKLFKKNREFCETHPEIPLQKASDLRNVLIHDYAEVNWTLIWNTAKHDLPDLLAAIAPYLEDNGNENR